MPLPAALVLLSAGYSVDAIEQALAVDPHVPGRMERVILETGPALHDEDQSRMPLAFVDFAHTPDAVAAARKALRHHTSGALIVVLGAGGDRDAGKRSAMGAAAASHADIVFVTDDNPRSEDPAEIRAAVLAGAISRTAGVPRVREIGDRSAAIRAAVALSGVGDTVVVLGKGHESGQDIGGAIHPFDDRAELRAALIEHAAPKAHTAGQDPVGQELGHRSADVSRGEVQ